MSYRRGSNHPGWKGGTCGLNTVDDVLGLTDTQRQEILTYLLGRSVDSGDCREWRGHLVKGYGMCGGRHLCHRLMYVLVYLDPVGSFKVCHTCDNPKCINPDHLFKGTHQDNVDDQVSKMRQCYGECNGRAKLTDDQVLLIRKLYRYGSSTYGQTQLSRMFGVAQPIIGKIVRGKLWKHLPINRGIVHDCH